MNNPDEFLTAIPSGFHYAPEAEQEKYRQAHKAMMQRLLPKFEDWDRTMGRARVAARTAYIG